MLKVLTVVGARPQFVKAAAVSRAFAKSSLIEESIVHTGQHFSPEMSKVFFDELSIPQPVVNLGVGGGAHGITTGKMLAALEEYMTRHQPDWVLVYGDTNSTLAGGLAASKLQIPVAHVEAGLRSYNRRMPEEVNRVLTDHLSTDLFCPTPKSVRCLEAEGITTNVHLVGDVMFDVVKFYQSNLKSKEIREKYLLCTLHRAENVDHRERLDSIIAALGSLGQRIVFPIHPRTRKRLVEYEIALPRNVDVISPLSYIPMLQLVNDAELVLTDSGGLQKEAYFLGKPCVTLRDETEWVELIDAGANVLAGSSPKLIVAGVAKMRGVAIENDVGFGDGNAAGAIVRHLESGV